MSDNTGEPISQLMGVKIVEMGEKSSKKSRPRKKKKKINKVPKDESTPKIHELSVGLVLLNDSQDLEQVDTAKEGIKKRKRQRKRLHRSENIGEDHLEDITLDNNEILNLSQTLKTADKKMNKKQGQIPLSGLTKKFTNLSLNSNALDLSGTSSNQEFRMKPSKVSNNKCTDPQKVKVKEVFDDYISKDEAEKGLEDGVFIKGEVRINPKNFKEAYISDPDNGQDIAILGVSDRNRALESDIVAIKIKDKSQWHKRQEKVESSLQRTAKVVCILEKVHSRIGVGYLKNVEKNYALFCPRDHKIPRMQIPVTTLSMQIIQNPEKYKNTLFIAQIITWNQPQIAHGLIKDEIGERGNLKSETDAILIENRLENEAVPEVLNKYLPEIPYTITQEEISSRLDLRSKCIFSIDPETARDLDDAVSIEQLGDDEFEVGVHISDVSFFLRQGTPLEEAVAKRATTVYMVQTAIHMLPHSLCMLCSLLPGEDKLAISVLWRMDSEGNIKDEPKMGRSVINSCGQLSYEHAQMVIDDLPVEFPTIHNGFTGEEIKKSILSLHKIAKNLRQKRFEGGALRIDQPKAYFTLNADCLPTDVKLYELKESNRLIEEFMLLANTTVARFLARKKPEIALLRRHNPPKLEMLSKLEQALHKLGIFLKIDSAGDLHDSIWSCSGGDPIRHAVLNLLCSKPMCRADYYCFSDDTNHYALNVDLYTHFTSPIRRYADIVVHRVLTAVLGYTELPPWSTKQVRAFAVNCNNKKSAAKKAGEQSAELFAGIYIKSLGHYVTKGIVFAVYSYSFEVIIMDLALNQRVYTQTLDGEFEFTDDGTASSLLIKWKSGPSQLIQVFSVVNILLTPMPDTNFIKAELLPSH